MGLVYSLRVVSLCWPYLGGSARTADAVASRGRMVLLQNIVDRYNCQLLLGATKLSNSIPAVFILMVNLRVPILAVRLGTLGKTVY